MNRRVHQIYSSAKHLLALINEILDLARIESGKMVLSLKPTLIHSVVEETVATITPLADRSMIRVHIEPPEQTLIVKADYTRLKRIMINLLSNAIKYNRTDGWIRLTWRTTSEQASIQVIEGLTCSVLPIRITVRSSIITGASISKTTLQTCD